MTTILAPEDSAKRIGASKASHFVEMWGCGDGGANSTTMRIAGRDEELRRLRAKLKRLTEERNILKKAPHTLPGRPGSRAPIRLRKTLYPDRPSVAPGFRTRQYVWPTRALAQ